MNVELTACAHTQILAMNRGERKGAARGCCSGCADWRNAMVNFFPARPALAVTEQLLQAMEECAERLLLAGN
jgi:hypothetical protein